MRWQCALLQRWLPEYPDGDLPAIPKRWLKAHVERCPACRQELQALQKAAAAFQATPVADPGPEFWTQFSRELHVKLAQAAPEVQPAPPMPSLRRFGLPLLLGAPALAALLLWVAVQFPGTGQPVKNQTLAVRQKAPTVAAVSQAGPTKSPAAPAADMEAFVPVALVEGAALPVEEVDISGWDLDSELAGMSDQEKEAFLERMHQQKKDGSCIEGLSYCSWG